MWLNPLLYLNINQTKFDDLLKEEALEDKIKK